MTSEMTTAPADLEARLEALESELGRLRSRWLLLRFVATALATTLVCVLAAAASQLSGPTNTVSARNFEVLDKRGQRRALLGLEGSGDPVLRLFGVTGTTLFNLHVSLVNNDPSEAVELELLNNKNDSKCRLNCSEFGADFALIGTAKTSPTGVSAIAGKEANLFLIQDKSMVNLRVADGADPSIVLKDMAGNTTTRIP